MVEGRSHKPVIDDSACRTCNVCVSGCPAEYIPEYRKEEQSLRGALYSGQRAKPCGREKMSLPPCRVACPIDLGTRDYVRLIAERKFLEAVDLIREELPFPGIIGRICHHPCEEACLRAKNLDEGVSLCALKRFVADYEVGKREIPVIEPGARKGALVAVVGGGPSGMACALALRRAGYGVTIFEGSDRLGGMLYWGVPAYRLPRDVIEREVSIVEKAGIEVRYSTMVGKDISLKEMREAFDAVYIGCGAQAGAMVGLEKETAKGVASGVEFLRRANEHRPEPVAGRVLVVGGGNVAVDAALTAKRVGAKEVRLVCLEKRAQMPASEWEVEQCRQEGIKIENGWGPKSIIAEKERVTAVEFKRCTAVFDREGCFNPSYSEGVTKRFDADRVIIAVGQAPQAAFLTELEGLEITEGGWIKADGETFETSLAGIFAGGDIVTGPAMAIEAISAGKRAAVSIDRYLSTCMDKASAG